MSLSASAGTSPRDVDTLTPAPPSGASPPSPIEPPSGRRRRWAGLARSTRTRIVILFVVLLAVPALLGTFALRAVLAIRLDDRVRDALEQEILELDLLLANGRDPQTGQRFTSLEALFDVYLSRNFPSNEEAMLVFVDGGLYRSSLSRFPVEVPREVLADWADLSNAPVGGGDVTGEFDTEAGSAQFRASPIRFAGDDGAFVVTILPHDERNELQELQRYGVAGTVTVLLLASTFAWLIAGRVLAPVQLLTETASAISQSELTRRVKVTGTDEAATMARSFNSMLDRLEGVLRSQQEFVQDASHELRNPLTVARGHLELLGGDPEERRTTIVLVMDELNRMARIVDDLQVLAESEQREFIRPEWIDMELFAHEITAKASALAPRTWKLDQAVEGMLLVDRHRMTEAVMNLADNAVHHTVREDTIALGVSMSDDEGRIWVRDTGCGMSESDQAHIFDRFTRGRGAHLRYRGSGLGLAIVKAIAEAHGGRVELESRLGEGSTVTIVVPRNPEGTPSDA